MRDSIVSTIRLDYRDEKRQVLIEPADHDQFMLTVSQAAAACAIGGNAIQFFKQMEDVLLPRLARWIKSERNGVKRAFVTVRDRSLLFLVVRSSVPFDLDFEERLAELTMDVANDPEMGLIRLSALALPCLSDEAVTSFLDNRMALEFASAN